MESKKIIALGFFDTVHLGHRKILNELKMFSQEMNAEPYVSTFDDKFLQKVGREDKNVFTLSERLDILESLSLSKVIVFETNKEFLHMDGLQFIMHLKTKYNAVGVLAGEDYSFGKGGKMNASDLEKYAKEVGLKCFIVPLLYGKNTKKISSSEIRCLLKEGNVQSAESFLGSPYFIKDRVSFGRGDGKKHFIPTANFKWNEEKEYPKEGVYSTITEVLGKKFLSITNVGTQPTFDSYEKTIETFILDFNEDIYETEIKVYFKERIRNLIKFSSKNELYEQIQKDIEKVKNGR